MTIVQGQIIIVLQNNNHAKGEKRLGNNRVATVFCCQLCAIGTLSHIRKHTLNSSPYGYVNKTMRHTTPR